ncbi:C1 family peptidase [Mastigocoleus sp. MO_188.B34]|uniref:C1 family peptidase n=1 Tax=Mastigocoleus sp. MO_188.B34 TaxID=3036635 RepID=UPI00262869A3|nr:C1 family peptidase [Mastigocoleus sp. MO_188.B34]MDJ0696617.1 C1 family peptidase [Mastigocoleus sp. MO_188.B34]
MNNRKDQNQKTDWKKKGLGWIPEYPNLREYIICNEEPLRLKQEEKTGEIEKIAAALIDFLEYERRNKTSSNPERDQLIENATDQLKNILGSVTFIKVKHHKLFRYSELDKDKKNKLLELPYQRSISKQQILMLKKYLALLLIGNYFPDQKLWEKIKPEVLEQKQKLSEQSKQEIYAFLNSLNKKDKLTNWIAKWMDNYNYDLITQELVRLFQFGSQIEKDGVLGLETYTTFNDCFNDGEKLSDLKSKLEKGEDQYEKNISRIRLISIYSVMPDSVINKILTILIDKVTGQIYQEYKDFVDKEYKQINNEEININNKHEEFVQILFDHEFLKKEIHFNGKIFKKTLLSDWEKTIKNISANLEEDDISDFLHSCASDNDDCFNHSLQSNNIIKVLSKFYVIEPIVAAMITLISPIAQFKYKNLEDIIEEGFTRFNTSCSSNNNDYKKKHDTLDENLSNRIDKLVEDAITRVRHLMKIEINYVAENDVHNKKNIIFLCFLVIKYLDSLNVCERQKQTHENNIDNIFDREDIFEIIDEGTYDNDSMSADNITNTLDLFPTSNLRIPVIDISFLGKEIKKTLEEKKVPYCVLPRVVDLSFWFSPVRDQGGLNSCTAFAATALFEYFVNRNFKENVSASPLFLYNVARKKMNITGDIGASIRETIKAMALYGVPPEESWPYEENKADDEPPAYIYAYAQNYKALKYFLLDYAGISKESLLFQIKAVLAAGFPCIFGFTVYTSAYEESNEPGHIPFPDADKDSVVGGHTVVAVGYDDYKLIKCANRINDSKGAILFENSWGPEWGIDGYGWLPYDYVLAGLTGAWWSLLKFEWFKGNKFGAAGSGGTSSNEVTEYNTGNN